MLKIKNVVKSNESKQVNNGVVASVNTDTYVKLGVASHAQYNNDVSMLKSQYIFDTTDNIALYSPTQETIDFTRFETIGEEPIICGCIKIQDIIDFYANGCIQQFYECFCSSHSDSESIVLARFLSAIGIEVWKDVTCYDGMFSGLYLVSNLGRVLSLNKRYFGKIVKQEYNPCGYLYVQLWCKGKVKNVRVHRLVALTFYGEPTEKLECCHSNTNSHDNRLFNLDFKTHSENMLNPLTQKKNKDTWATKAKAKATTSTTESASATTSAAV